MESIVSEDVKPLEISFHCVPNVQSDSILKDIKQFCAKEGIKHEKLIDKKKGQKRKIKLFFKKEDWSRVNSYLDKILLGM